MGKQKQSLFLKIKIGIFLMKKMQNHN